MARSAETIITAIPGGIMYVRSTDADLAKLDPTRLDEIVHALRAAETHVRHFRKRVEALRDQSARGCAQCGGTIAGRLDARYCSTTCRVKAHRDRTGVEPE